MAKYTICPAIAHGLEAEVGSIAEGKLADLVLWQPKFFGVRPDVVLKAGMVAWAAIGDPNASIPTPEPVLSRPMFSASPQVAAESSIAFTSRAAIEAGFAERAELGANVLATESVTGRSKADLPENDALPRIEVDPERFCVRIDGTEVEPVPASEVPMARRYFLF